MIISVTTISLAFVVIAHFYGCKTEYAALFFILWTPIKHTKRRLLESKFIVFGLGRLL